MRNVFQYDKPFVVFDVETSGVDEKNSSVIQIGAVKLSKKLNVVDEFNVFIRPYTSHWDEQSYKTHKLTKEFLHEKGSDLRIALLDFKDWIGSPRKYYLGQWGCGFDVNMINEAHIHAKMVNPFGYKAIDIASIVKFNLFCKGYKTNLNLHQCAKILGINIKKYKAHDGLDDTKLTVECLQKVRDEQIEKTNYKHIKNR